MSTNQPSLWKQACSKIIFEGSFDKFDQLPYSQEIEFAFIGRSNVGKSSLINALCSRNIARTSKTPGKTRQFVYFNLPKIGRLVDLPGYGYAKVSARHQALWHKEIHQYLKEREALKLLVILIDSRHGLKKSDRDMLEWAQYYGKKVFILFTKWDKIRANQRAARRKELENEFQSIGLPYQRVSVHDPQLQRAVIEKLLALLKTVPTNNHQPINEDLIDES